VIRMGSGWNGMREVRQRYVEKYVDRSIYIYVYVCKMPIERMKISIDSMLAKYPWFKLIHSIGLQNSLTKTNERDGIAISSFVQKYSDNIPCK
jgi:hypothetical protein